MEENKKWRMNYSDYTEPDKGIESIGKTIIHVTLALIVLGVVYTVFAKTEWEPAVRPSVTKTNTAKPQTGDAERLEEYYIDENGLRASLKTQERKPKAMNKKISVSLLFKIVSPFIGKGH